MTTTTTEQQQLLLPLLLPADVWAEAALALLDAKDIRRMTKAAPLLLQSLPLGDATFAARRVLTSKEIAWFAEHQVRVKLLVETRVLLPDYTRSQRVGNMYLFVYPYQGPTQCWLRNGVLHRDDDLPAVVSANGYYREWRIDGKLHRDGDQPAMIGGEKREWYQHGKLHRDDDQPALILDYTRAAWYQHGEWLHDDGDQPALIAAGETREWYIHGELHRDGDRPAVMTPGIHRWYQHGKLHRDGDLPAVVWQQLGGRCEWWVDGIQVKVWCGLPQLSSSSISIHNNINLDYDGDEMNS